MNGQNGVGKSSLFMDAIADCLYEQTRKEDIGGWVRDGTKSGSITFSFALGGQDYRVIRTRTKSGRGTLALQRWNPEGDAWADESDTIIDSTPGNVGIPIGNQSSQVYALLYLNELDHYVKEVLRMRYYGRYMDDFYIICESKEALREAWKKVEQLLAPRGLELNQKTQIFPLRNGLDFLGFHTYLTDTGKVIRKVRRSSKDRMRRKLRKYAVMYENGAMTRKQIEESYQSWRSHASHGQCRSLITKYDAVCASIFERSVKSNHAAENQRPTRKGESAGHKD